MGWGGGYPPELAWWTGEVDQDLITEGVGGGSRAGLVDGGGGARASVPGG